MEVTMPKFDVLWADYTWVKPINFDWSEGYLETWDYMEAVECENEIVGPELKGGTWCGEVAIAGNYCPSCGGDIDFGEGPMMSYYYIVNFRRVGGMQDAALALVGLPLCPVRIANEIDAIALTGGGMDLSWEIAEAYTRLGYLPPVHFARLPRMAGMTWNKRTKRVVKAALKSIEVVRRNLRMDEADLLLTKEGLKEATRNAREKV
jgi:hypothetical protein